MNSPRCTALDYIDFLVATLAPQCNIDGFAILTSDPVAAEARLDVAQLQAQFGARTTGR